MRDLTIPLIITVVALIAALSAYRGIRRGGARFYTLEREAMLRRASFTLIASILLFLGAVGLMTYNYQQMLAQGEDSTLETEEGVVTVTPETVLETSPPTPTITPTIDPNIPPPTATPVICRALIEGTGGSGLTLRDTPGGNEIIILTEGTIVSVLETEPVQADNFTWRNIRTVAREEGWVVEDFLTIGDCN